MYFQFVFFLFYDSQVHEEHSGIFMLGNNYFIRKRCWYITFTCQWVDIVRSVWVTLTDPFSGQIYHSIVSLDALLCPFSYEAACVGDCLFVFLPSFLSLPEKIHLYPLSFGFVNFSLFVFLLIIVVFDHVIKVLVIFNLVLELQFVIFFSIQ